jgi:hypothetical protein
MEVILTLTAHRIVGVLNTRGPLCDQGGYFKLTHYRAHYALDSHLPV